MRPLAPRRLTALAISAALALGAAGPAFADDHRPSRAAVDRAARAPLPDATALPVRTEALADVGGVTTPWPNSSPPPRRPTTVGSPRPTPTF